MRLAVGSLAWLAIAMNLNAQKPIIEGWADSPVRVIIYEDLQCSDCATFRHMLDQKLLPAYGTKVAFIHRDFPLAKHLWARRAAIAARFFTERSPELGLEYRKYMMSSQEATTDTNFNQRLIAFAQANHVPSEEAVAALTNAHYAEMVEQDYQDGVARGVVHTPTVFVNGTPFIETFSYDAVAKSIDDALGKAR